MQITQKLIQEKSTAASHPAQISDCRKTLILLYHLKLKVAIPLAPIVARQPVNLNLPDYLQLFLVDPKQRD